MCSEVQKLEESKCNQALVWSTPPLFPPETCLDEGMHREDVPPDDCLLFQPTLEVIQTCGRNHTHFLMD